MVPQEFRKNLCVIAGWVSLLEALVWGALAIYGVGVYGCSWGFIHTNKGPNTWSMLYVTYFMGSCDGVSGAANQGFLLAPPTDPAKHLHIWLWIHMVLSVAWIPACILLTVAASVEVRGRQGAILYYPWITLSCVFVIFDLAGAVYHFLDVLHSTTPDYYADMTFHTSWSNLTTNYSVEGITPWLPSLLVTLYFCRFIFFWGLNIVFLYIVYKGCNAVSLYTTKYLQSSLMQEDSQKSWKNRFYQGPDPSLFEQSPRQNQTKTDQQRIEDTKENAVRHRMQDFGIPEDVRPVDQRVPTDQDRSGGPWRENNAPPIASGVQVPPELNKFEPFSYIAGDQPQRMRRPVSRSNSRGDQPPIPRPDYSISERKAASLEYVPNRFRVPSPKRLQSQSSFNLDSAGRPVTTKVAPVPPKKPSAYPRSIPEDPERYVNHPTTQQTSPYTRQASGPDYNINKLY
ncbi:uncharacterized protein LOC128994062 [Macrosteles quadrilineatus]|uniref:uncharacterized protein LOC128994062 n=1 Tax=Macrosteles quadrilineatus TaxID=74068 RepID=UPI0023E1044F|nr:uncharacterized protein LOC128994062 [Macrosteles quadrilineatus]